MAPKRKPMFSCTHCDYRSMIPSNVRGHVTRVHKITNPKIHECRFCGEMFGNLHKLNFHMGATYCANTNEEFARELEEKAEKRKTNFYCLECNYQSYLSYNVISHMINVHKVDDPKIHGCKCGEMYRRASELKEHTLICEESDPNFRGRPTPIKAKAVHSKSVSKSRNLFRKSVKIVKKRMDSKISMANLVRAKGKGKNVKNSSRVKGKGNVARISSSNSNNSSSNKTSTMKVSVKEVKNNRRSTTRERFAEKSSDDDDRIVENSLSYPNIRTNQIKSTKVQKCQKCKRVFPNVGKLRAHLREDECKILKTVFGKRQGRKPAKLDRMFHCLECEYQSPYTCHVRTHMKLKHNVSEPKIHKCEFCSEMFQTIIILKKHQGDNFCVNTNEEFAQKVREAEENKCYYNCLKCDYLSAYKHHIRNHMRVIHKIADPKFYSCETCGETFAKEPSVIAHMKSCLGQNAKDARKKTKSPNQIYTCEKCGVVFDDKNHYEGHKEFTNCKKRRKVIKRGEIFGESSAFRRQIPIDFQRVTNNLSPIIDGISPVKTLKTILPGANMKITGLSGVNNNSRKTSRVLPRPKHTLKTGRSSSRGKGKQNPARSKKQTSSRGRKPKKAQQFQNNLSINSISEQLPTSISSSSTEDNDNDNNSKPFHCLMCPETFESTRLLDTHFQHEHSIHHQKWNGDFDDRDKDAELLISQPQSSGKSIPNEMSVKMEISLLQDDCEDIQDPSLEEEETEGLLLEEKEANNQYITHAEENLDEGGFHRGIGTCPVEIEDTIGIETTEVEGPSTDSENYYIFDDLSSTYITESQNFIVHGIDGTVYDGEVYSGMEIGEGFNIDPSSAVNDCGNDNVFYQFQFCDGGSTDENVVLMEDSEFINSNMTDNDLTLVEFVPNHNNNVGMSLDVSSDSSTMTMGVKSEENQYQCKLCSFVSSNESAYEIHLKKHN